MVAASDDADRALSPLSSAQQRLWLAAEAEGGGSSYHLGWMARLVGDLDIAALRAALDEVVARHEALRTWLVYPDGQPRLRVVAAGPAVVHDPAVARGSVTLPIIEANPGDADARAAELVIRPFEAAAGPLWRAALLRLGPAEHRLVLVVHHLIADMATAGVLFTCLSAAYRTRQAGEAGRGGTEPGLPAAPPHSAYREWEREFLRGPRCAAQVAYWTGQVANVSPLELPGARPRLAGSPRQGALIGVRIPARTTDVLRRLGRAQGGTITHVALAGYATVLHRYSGTEVLAIGVPVSTRKGRRWAASAGLYVNTLPIRVTLTGNPPFEQLVRQVRDTVLAALGAADVPLDQVTAALQASGEAGARGLYDVTFGMAGGGLELDLPGLRTHVTAIYGGHAKFDLHLEVTDQGPGQPLRLTVEYDTGLLTQRAARRILRSIVTLLTQAAAAPAQRIGFLPLWNGMVGPELTEEQQQRPSHAGAGSGEPVPTVAGGASAAPGEPVSDERMADMPEPLPGGGRVDVLLAQMAVLVPDKVAIVNAASGGQLRYAELAGRAAGLGAELAARGVGRGEFVGLTLARSADLVVAIAGVLTAGAAYVPLDASYPVARLAEMIAMAGISLVIGPAPPGLAVPVIDFPALAMSVPDLSAPDLPVPDQSQPVRPATDLSAPDLAAPVPLVSFPHAAGQPVPGGGSGEDAAYVMFTSGSTGAPKAVVVPHRAIVRLVRDSGFAEMTAGERWLHAASPSFDAATLELWAPLLNGGTLVVLTGAPEVGALGEAIARHQVTSAFLTTGLFNAVVDTDVSILAPLRQLIIGGETASARHVRRALRVVGTVVNGYGPTENTTFTSCYVMRAGRKVASPVPIGRPIRGTTVRIVDAYLNPLPPGAIGEILVGGQGLAIGYAGAPGLTAERFVPSASGQPGARLYRTGDYGWLGPGGILHFAGRRDDQVKVRGFRVELGAAEHELLGHPGVAQAAVVVHTDPTGDRRLVGYTVGPATAGELTAYLRETLPEYLIPGQWIRLAALPLGPAGKVDRHALPPPEQAPAVAERPPTAIEQLLIDWYRDLLGVTSAGPDTNFLAVGGHSLVALRLANRIQSQLAVDVSLSAIFSIPRLADLAAMVEAKQTAAGQTGTSRG
jgi:amino acid adenylation domain-containing protein